MYEPTMIQLGWPAAAVAAVSVLLPQLFQFLSSRRIEKKVEATHVLVNSGDKVKLEMIVAMARRLADSGTQADKDALRAAEKALTDHILHQAIVDSKV